MHGAGASPRYSICPASSAASGGRGTVCATFRRRDGAWIRLQVMRYLPDEDEGGGTLWIFFRRGRRAINALDSAAHVRYNVPCCKEKNNRNS